MDRVQQKKEREPRPVPASGMLWIVLSRVLTGWEDLAQPMKPATVNRRKPHQPSPVLPERPRHLRSRAFFDFEVHKQIGTKGRWRSANPRLRM